MTKRVMMQKKWLMVMAVLATPFVFAAGESVDETRQIPDDSYVSISVVRGEVEVVGWDKSAVQVVGTLDEQTEEFIFEVDGNETRIIVELEQNGGSFWGGDQESRLEIYVPKQVQIEFKGVSTDIGIEAVLGDLEVGVVSGDIAVTGSEGRVDLTNVSGDTEINNVSGRLRASAVSGDIQSAVTSGESDYDSVSGDITINGGPETIEVETVSGDIEVDAALIRSASGHTVSGDIEVAGQLADGGFIDFDSVSGEIELRLGGEVDADVRMQTGSGSIKNGLSDHKPQVSDRNPQKVRFTLGTGEGELRLNSRSGDLTLDVR